MEDEIRRRDIQVFIKEVTSPLPLVACILAALIVSAASHTIFVTILLLVVFLGVWALYAWTASKRKRFYDPHFLGLWDSCEERHNRFIEVFERGKKRELSGVTEMPQTIEGVKISVYKALRKSDIITHELHVSEGSLSQLPKVRSGSTDAQSQELLQVADRNFVEYHQALQSLMSGVQRTEAQAAVFMTTIDSLRMRMLGHRLAGRAPEMGSHELLAAMAEAKLQLQSIDKALDELDLGLYPQRIAPPTPEARDGISGVRPPPPPASVSQAKPETETHQENRS